MIVMVIGLGFAAVAVTIAATSQGETQRDQDRKAALAIAEAGAQRAMLTYNKITTTTANPCVVKSNYGSNATLAPGPIPSSTSPFCRQIGGATNADSTGIDPDARVGTKDGYFTYWVRPCDTSIISGTSCNFPSGPGVTRTIKIVSQGYQRGVTRRVAITASGIRGQLTNTKAKAIGLDDFSMEGWSELEVDAATNGNFTMRRQGGCPGQSRDGTWSDADGINDNDGVGGLSNGNGCPRVCLGDWYANIKVTVGTAPDHDVSYPSGTQGCTLHDTNRAPLLPDDGDPNTPRVYNENPTTWKPRVNPPGPPEIGTLPPPDAIPAGNGYPGDSTAPTVTVSHKGDLSLTPINSASLPPANSSTGDLRLASCTLPAPPGSCGLNTAGKESASGQGTITWSSATRTLTLNGTGDLSNPLRLNIGGADYNLCKLTMTGYSQLIMASGASSRLFFDSPENCIAGGAALGNPAVQLSVSDYSRIGSETYDSLNYNPNITDPSNPNYASNLAKLALPTVAMVGSTGSGSSFIPTKAQFVIPVVWPNGAVQAQQMKLYAPLTDIVLDTGYSRENEGWFVGKTLAMKHGSEIESNPAMDPVGTDIVSPDFVHFSKATYVECGPPATNNVPIDLHC